MEADLVLQSEDESVALTVTLQLCLSNTFLGLPTYGFIEGNGNPLQYSCLENPMDRGACRLQFMGSQRVGHD